MNDILISKSKYISGLQCHKLLWHYYNAKNKIPSIDQATQALFDQGHLVGEFAKQLYPEGLNVSKGVYAIPSVVRQTAEAVKHRRPLFEVGFIHKNAFARADILNPVEKDRWDIIEVKSSTELKDENLHDLALQRYVYEGAGLSIRNCHIMHINNEYVRHDDIDPNKLFKIVDVTGKVSELIAHVEPNLRTMADVIKQKSPPEIQIGPYCESPYLCPLYNVCWDYLPEHNVFTLYLFGKKGFDMLARGITEILDMPDDVSLNDKQQIQLESLRTGIPHIDKAGIAAFLETLEYPLYFLDFETFMTAIPLFDDVRPYQQIPFQFSLHILKSKNEKPGHHWFLSDGKSDPRPQILNILYDKLGKSGSIIAYNASFEKARLKESCETYTKYSKWYGEIEQRIVDLLYPFRSFYYYHSDQKGSASIKVVLPVLTGTSYEGMDISEGGTASLEFLRVTFNNVDESERIKVRKQLEEYCKLDTLGMIQIVEKLRELI